jgi:anti-sigma B factor antagonist
VKVAVERLEGVPVLTIDESRLLVTNAGELREVFARWVGPEVTRLVVDVSALTVMDSTGLGALVSAVKRADGARVVAVAGAKDAIATLFKLSRMDRVFRLHDTVAEAVAALREG